MSKLALGTLALVLAQLAACSSNSFVGNSRKKAGASNGAIPGEPTQVDAGDDSGKTDAGKTDVGSDDGDGKTDAPGTGDDAGTGTEPPIGGDDGSGMNPPTVVPTDTVVTIHHTCKDGVQQTYPLTGPGTRVKVDGELCPNAYGKLTVLFVIDFSGSMATADPRHLLSCGRAKAAQKILDAIRQDMRSGDDVQVGFVSFGNDAQLETSPTPIANFVANTFNFCGSENAATNYRRAFEETQKALAPAAGNKVVYLISDGLPTIGATNAPADNDDINGLHKAAGLKAAQDLKAAVPGLVLNAVFLNDGGAGTDAQSYLTQITGNANQVKLANDASQLADKIVELSTPKVELDPATASAALTAPGFPAAGVPLVSFTKSASLPGVWEFQTDAFSVNAVPNATVANVLTISAKDQSGLPHQESLVLLKQP